MIRIHICQKRAARLSAPRNTLALHALSQKNPGASRAPSCFSALASVNLLDSWTSISATTWHTAPWHTSFWHAATTRCLVHLHHDRINNAFDFFLLCLEFILF